MQVLPVELEGRLAILNKAGLNRGKARCIDRRVACLDVVTLQLPDVSQLSCVAVATAAAAAAAAGTGADTAGGESPGGAESGDDDDGVGDRYGRQFTDEIDAADGGGRLDSGELAGGASAPLPSLNAHAQQHLQQPGRVSGGFVGGVEGAAAMAAGSRGGGGLGGGGGVVGAPMVLGQATSPADAGARWAGVQMQMQMRSGPLRKWREA